MGDAAFINQGSETEPAHPVRRSRPVRVGLDFILLGVTAALVLFGMLMVYSSSPLFASLANQPADYFVKRQILWAVIGSGAIAGLTMFNYHWFRRLSVLMMLGTLGLLVLVEILGRTTFGADRSLLGPSVRPSELAKIVLIIYVAVWLDAKREVLNDISFGLLPLGFILGTNAALIVLQPDLSAAFTIVLLGGLMFFLAGGEWRQLGLVIVATILVGWIIVNILPTGHRRMTDYFQGLQSMTRASEHIQFSFQAIISGGLFGTGIGMGTLKFIGLPVAHTDSIFAVVAEETGLVGILLLVSAYLVILWRGLNIARHAPDNLGRLLAGGITFWIVLEAFMNIGVMVNLLPNAGNALPFISYGGSSLLTTMAGIGILLNIGRSAEQKQMEGEQQFGSVVDLRWRDGRRRVPRPVHPASTR
jgi:cell division protein FtsW